VHHALPGQPPEPLPGKGSGPHRILDVAAGFLGQAILQVRKPGFDVVDLDEIRRRFLEKNFGRRFVCFTLDDGYQDNFTTAYPVLLNIMCFLLSISPLACLMERQFCGGFILNSVFEMSKQSILF
jgi:hypothetical protein